MNVDKYKSIIENPIIKKILYILFSKINLFFIFKSNVYSIVHTIIANAIKRIVIKIVNIVQKAITLPSLTLISFLIKLIKK